MRINYRFFEPFGSLFDVLLATQMNRSAFLAFMPLDSTQRVREIRSITRKGLESVLEGPRILATFGKTGIGAVQKRESFQNFHQIYSESSTDGNHFTSKSNR